MKSKQSKAPAPREAKCAATPTKFVDRDLTKVNPLTQQFEPTDACPVRQRVQMAGGA